MSVPYIFANVPGGSTVPLAEFDANFAYLTNNPTLNGLTLTGNLSVGQGLLCGGPATFNSGLSFKGTFGVNGSVVSPTGTTGSGLLVLNSNPSFVSPNLGQPTAGDLSLCSGYLVTKLSGLGDNVAQFLVNPSSGNLENAVTDSTGNGNLVFNENPNLIAPVLQSPVLGIPASGNLQNCTGYQSVNLSGVVPIANGGTGLSAVGSLNQILQVTSSGTLGYAALPPAGDIKGGAASQLVYQVNTDVTGFLPNGVIGQALLSNGVNAPSWGLIDLTTNVTNILPYANGGTNASSRQAAMNGLAGAVTANWVMRADGTNVIMGPLIPADISAAGTLTNNTTGSASTFTSITQNSQFNSIGVNVAASGTAGQINATGNINTSGGYFTDKDATLHPIILGSVQSASGAQVIFNNIPSWVNRIIVMFQGVNAAAGGYPEVLLGTSSGLVTAGYNSNCAAVGFGFVPSTSGFNISSNAGGLNDLIWTIYRVTGNTWISNVQGISAATFIMLGTGTVVLPGQIGSVGAGFSGGGTYTGGNINIQYE